MKLVCDLLLGLLNLFYEGLYFARAFLLRSLNFALRRFDPTERNGQIYAHKEVLFVVDEGDSVGYVFLVADFVVLCVLVEIGLVFADHNLVLVFVLVDGASDEGELEIAAGRNTGEDQD